MVSSTALPSATHMGDEFGDDLAAEHVETGRRLIEQQHRRSMDERAGEMDALTLSGAEGGAAAFEDFREIQQRGETLQFGAGRDGRHLIEIGAEQQHLADGQMLIEGGAGGDEADLPFHFVGRRGGAPTADGRLSGRRAAAGRG